MIERDPSKPAEQQGLFRKFDVTRTDGSSAPGGKHDGCRYFVLDLDHDAFARAALRAYAVACADTHPHLCADLLAQAGAAQSTEMTTGQYNGLVALCRISRYYEDGELRSMIAECLAEADAVAAQPVAQSARQQPTELDMHRADYQDVRAAGFESPGELLSAYQTLLKKLPRPDEQAAILAALKPFADAYRPELRTNADEPKFGKFLDANTITPQMTVGDFRRAHEAVANLTRPVEQPNFCSRCGKRLALDSIHTCSPPREDVTPDRYEFVRTLTPQQFTELWTRNLRGEGPFDALVDASIEARRECF